MKIRKFLLPVLAVVLTCFYPCAFSYLENAGEARGTDMLPMLGIFLATALVLLTISALLLRRFAAGGLFTCIAMLAVCNCGLIARFLKHHLGWFRDRYLLLAAAVVLVLLLIFLWRHKRFPAQECCGILAVLFAALTVMKLIPAAPTLWRVLSFQPAQLELEADTFQGDKPNVYYFILDEYGGTENLDRYYDFDNEDFHRFLADNRFNVSDTSKNTESIWTSTLVPNLLNLGYCAEDRMPERVKLRYLEKPLLFRVFWDNGYDVNLISHRSFISAEGCRLLSDEQLPDRITIFLFDNSIYSLVPGLRGLLRNTLGLEDHRDHAQNVQDIFDCMEGCYAQVGDKPTLTVSYVQCPHYPFVFDAQGNVVDGGRNIQDKHFYLDQLAYVNTVLETSIQNILDTDPDCLIVLQSDHGTRYPGQMLLYYGEPDYDPVLETPYMQNVLNCVYWGGRPLNIEGETGINTWRLILREVFGVDLAPLTPPEGYTCYGRSWQDKPKDFE